MPEETPAPPSETAPATVPPPADTDPAAEAEKWKAQARKHEARAKANATAQAELDKLRADSMSDQEKAVAQAKAEGRSEALREAGGLLVDAEIRVAAAGRLAEPQVAVLLQGLDRAKFMNEDGTVDATSVATFVAGLAPAEPAPAGFPDLGQGTRGSTLPLNGDPLVQAVKSKLGIR